MRLGSIMALVCIVSILCVTTLIIVALANGINGVILTTGIASIIAIPTFFITRITTQQAERKRPREE